MMVIVEDDCALQKGKGITGGRGIAGTIFVHKIAGATAARGLSLEEVHAGLFLLIHSCWYLNSEASCSQPPALPRGE